MFLTIAFSLFVPELLHCSVARLCWPSHELRHKHIYCHDHNPHVTVQLQSMGLQSVATGDAVAGHLLRPPPTLDKESAVNIANTNITVDAALVSANNRCAAAAGLSSVSDLLIWNDIVPNQSHFPVRIGRDVSPPFDTFSDGPRVVTFAEIEFNKTLAALGLTAGVRSPQQFVDLLSAMPRMGATGPGGASMAAQRDSDWPPLHGAGKVLGYQQHQGGQAAESALPWHAQGLHELAVVKAAAAGPCSVALTAAGEVWMFGYGQEQQFANGNAVQTEGWPVDGRPARLIAEQGGAVDVVAGAAFCAALTRSGAVVLWGRGAPQGMLCSGGTTRFVKALPKMTRVAAGRAHLLMSDGASVWQLRIRHDADTPAAVLSTLKRVRFEVRPSSTRTCLAGREKAGMADAHAPQLVMSSSFLFVCKLWDTVATACLRCSVIVWESPALKFQVHVRGLVMLCRCVLNRWPLCAALPPP